MSSGDDVTRSAVRRRLDQFFAANVAAELPPFAPERDTDRFTIAGGRIGLVRRIGVGSFGEVFLGVDHVLGRQVAVKIPRFQGAMSPALLHRFDVEAKSLARLDHPAIACVLEADVRGEVPYIVSEFCSGPDLASWMRTNRCDDLPEVLRLACVLAGALHHAHLRGVIHRDIKPANILLRPKFVGACRLSDFDPLLTDFGLARLFDATSEWSSNSALIGTPLFMAPEQAWGDADVGPASDVYSLAAVMMQLINDGPIRDAETYAELMEQLRIATPPKIDCRLADFTVDHAAVCRRALAHLPEHRYPSASDFAEDLQCLIDGRTPSARTLPIGSRVWRRIAAPHRLVEYCRAIQIIAAVRIFYAGASLISLMSSAALKTTAAERFEFIWQLVCVAVPYDVALFAVTHRRSHRGLPNWLETATLITLIAWTVLMFLSTLNVVEASTFYRRSAEARIAGLTMITLLFLAQTIAWIASRPAAARARRRRP
jgi:eukaryotic-like serine/threonine-protein kinase